MIIINYNGFKIEFDSIEDVTKFISGQKSKKIFELREDESEKEKKIPWGNASFKKKKKVMSLKNVWTEKELSIVVDLLRNEYTPNEIKRDSALRLRHNKEGIGQMVTRFFNGNIKATSPTVVKAVED